MIDIRKSWDKISPHYRKRYGISCDVVHYGPLCHGEDLLKLLGDIVGKKALDLGCGCGQNSIALSRLGADVTALDFSQIQLEQAKALALEKNANVKFLQADISDISGLAGEQFDLAISACAISFVENINSVFAGAFRLIKSGSTFILSDMHPLQYILEEDGNGVVFNNTYPFSPILMKWRWDFDTPEKKDGLSVGFRHYVRSIPFYYKALRSAGFEVDDILEPEATLETPHIDFSLEIWNEYRYIAKHLPITFIMKCRKP